MYLLLEVAHLFPFSKLRRKIKFENKYASAVIRLLLRLLVRETSNVLNRNFTTDEFDPPGFILAHALKIFHFVLHFDAILLDMLIRIGEIQ